jgi:hypothetical protein
MSLLSRLKGLLRIDRLERDLDEELRSHIDMRTRDNLGAWAKAMEWLGVWRWPSLMRLLFDDR